MGGRGVDWKPSGDPEYYTPQDLFLYLDNIFCFDVDVCAKPGVNKVETFYSPEEDGLSREWAGNCWMNPPYASAEMKQWIRKAYVSARDNKATTVCLLPASTDTLWWHNYAMKASEIWFIRGRLNFTRPDGIGGAGQNAPFPSAIVIFRKGNVTRSSQAAVRSVKVQTILRSLRKINGVWGIV